MILYSVYQPTEDISGSSYFASKREALAFARRCQREGSYCTLSRLVTPPLTQRLFLSAMNEQGFVTEQQDLARFEPKDTPVKERN